MSEDPRFKLPVFKPASKYVPEVYQQSRMPTPSYSDLSPGIMGELMRTAKDPLVADAPTDILDSISTFYLGLPSAMRGHGGRRADDHGAYTQRIQLETQRRITEPWKGLGSFLGLRNDELLTDPENGALTPRFDPSFAWNNPGMYPQWEKMRAQLPAMYWDDLRDARSLGEAQELIDRVGAQTDYQAAWAMWNENIAQETLAQKLLYHPKTYSFGKDISLAFTDPLTVVGVGASLKVSKKLASYIKTIRSAKLTKPAWRAWGASEVAEVGIGLATMDLMAARDGTTENDEQYIMAALLSGVLGGIFNAAITTRGITARLARRVAITDEFTLRGDLERQVQSETGRTAQQLLELRGRDPEAYAAAMDEIANDAVVRQARDAKHRVRADEDPVRFKRIAQREAQRINEILDAHTKVEADIISLGASIHVLDDMSLAHYENVGVASILDDVGVPTTAGIDDVVKASDATPKTPVTQVAADADEHLGPTFRFLLGSEAEKMGPRGQRLRSTILRITEGRPNILSIGDVRFLSKEAPEILSEMDLPTMMNRVASRRKANRHLAQAEQLKKKAEVQAAYNRKQRSDLPTPVGSIVTEVGTGRVGQVTHVSPSGQVVTVDYNFAREAAARRSGKIARPDVIKLRREVAAAEQALKSEKLTPKAEQLIKEQSEQAQRTSSGVSKKLNKLKARVEKVRSRLVTAEGRLEAAENGLARFELDEVKRAEGGLPPREKQLAAKHEKVKTAKESVANANKELQEGLTMVDDLNVEKTAADELALNPPGKASAIEEAIQTRKAQLKELRETLLEEEALEADLQQAMRTPEPIPRSRRSIRRERQTGVTEQVEEPTAAVEYDIESAPASGVEVIRGDQVVRFVLDDPVGQSLFPSGNKWDAGESVVKNSIKPPWSQGRGVTIEHHTQQHGFRVTLRRLYRRGKKGQMLDPESKILRDDGGRVTGSIKSAKYSVEIVDLDGRVQTQQLKARTIKEAQTEAAEYARQSRANSMLDPVRFGDLMGSSQAVKDMDLFGKPSLVEEVADGRVPKEYDGVVAKGGTRRSLYDVEFVGNGVDSAHPATALSPAWGNTVQLRRSKFKQLVQEEASARKPATDTPIDDAAALTESGKVAELAKTANKKGKALWRWIGMMGIRGNGLASEMHAMATAMDEVFGGAGVALENVAGGGFATTGTGAGTLGSGGIVPNRRSIMYRNMAPLVHYWETAVADYGALVGKSVKNPKDELSKAVYRYRVEGVLPDQRFMAEIVEAASKKVTDIGFPVEVLAKDPLLKELAEELEGIKSSPNYVMRVRNKGKFKQLEADVKQYWDESINEWHTVSHGRDFIELHFERMLIEGNPNLTHTAGLMSKQMVRFYMSDSEHALRMMDDIHGMKYKNAQEFVDAFEEVLRKQDEIPSGKWFGKDQKEPVNFFADDVQKQEFLNALRKDLGETEKLIRITMPRLKLGHTKMKVKFRDGTIRDNLGQLDYFEHDMIGLAARYQTEVYARAGMRHFLRQRWTDTWQPKSFSEYREVMIRAWGEQHKGIAKFAEAEGTIKRQLTFMENALLARPQYSRIGGVGHILQALSNLSTLRAIPGFVPAQFPEMGGAIYANGWSKITKGIPLLNKLVDDAANGRLSRDEASQYINFGLGMGWNENRLPSMFASIDHVENASPIARKVAGETVPIQMAGRLNEWTMENIPKASKWGGFAAAQNASDVVSAQELHSALVKVANAAEGTQSKAYRQFVGRDNVRLAQFGISVKDFDEIIGALRQDGGIIKENINGVSFTNYGWDNMSSVTKAKLDDLNRQWIRYYVQRSDDYSLPMLFATSELGKITQQFRTFSWGSNLNHLGRSMQARDSRALVAATNQIVFGAITHVGLGLMRFWNDPERLREYMSLENLIKGILMRSAFFGMGVDVVDSLLYAAGQDTFFSHSGTPMSMSIPAVQTVQDIARGGGAIVDTAFGDGLTDKNFARMKRLAAPFDKWLPLEILWPGLEEVLGVD